LGILRVYSENNHHHLLLFVKRKEHLLTATCRPDKMIIDKRQRGA
jgi:hypothetical protein